MSSLNHTLDLDWILEYFDNPNYVSIVENILREFYQPYIEYICFKGIASDNISDLNANLTKTTSNYYRKNLILAEIRRTTILANECNKSCVTNSDVKNITSRLSIAFVELIQQLSAEPIDASIRLGLIGNISTIFGEEGRIKYEFDELSQVRKLTGKLGWLETYEPRVGSVIWDSFIEFLECNDVKINNRSVILDELENVQYLKFVLRDFKYLRDNSVKFDIIGSDNLKALELVDWLKINPEISEIFFY